MKGIPRSPSGRIASDHYAEPDGHNSRGLKSTLDSALSDRWQKFEWQTERARSNPTEKAVHDFRVAMRRLIALLDMIDNFLPKSAALDIKKQLKSRLNSLSALRDTQVQILEVQKLAAEFGVLSPFLGELITRESIQSKRARKEIHRINVEPMKRQIDILSSKIDEILVDPSMEEISMSILRGLLAQIFVRMFFLRKEVASNSNDLVEKCEKIHRLRLLFKRFRYTVEILKPILPGVSDRLLKRMREFQLKMGTIRDTEVLLASISTEEKKVRKKEIKRGNTPPDQFGAVLELMTNRLDEELNAFLATLGELDTYWQRVK